MRAAGRRRAAAVGVGGAAGATLRWAVLSATPPGRFPWSVLAVNVAGSLLLGALLTSRRRLARDLGAVGFCGGLTTFSTFAVEVVRLAEDGRAATAVSYASLSVVATVAAVGVGSLVARR